MRILIVRFGMRILVGSVIGYSRDGAKISHGQSRKMEVHEGRSESELKDRK